MKGRVLSPNTDAWKNPGVDRMYSNCVTCLLCEWGFPMGKLSLQRSNSRVPNNASEQLSPGISDPEFTSSLYLTT